MKTVTMQFLGRQLTLPYEAIQVARELARGSNQTPEQKLGEILTRLVRDDCANPEAFERRAASGFRYCQAEGIDPEAFALKSCRNALKGALRDLRK